MAPFVTLWIVTFIGCQQSTTGRLLGTWRGRPDSAAAADKRSHQLKEKQIQIAGRDQDMSANGDVPSSGQEEGATGRTDLEQYDVAVELDFQRGGRVRMTLIGDDESLEGVWRVVADLPPNAAEIEIGLLAAKGQGVEEKRRFLIEFQEHGDAPGFTLREKGADPKFGRLYFAKAKP